MIYDGDGYILKDMVWQNIYATDETDVEKLEAMFLDKSQTWQEHLDAEGVTEEEHRKRNRKDAEDQVKVGVMIGAIGDKEKIDITPEEVEIRMQLLKGQYSDKAMQAELDKPEARQDIAARLRTEKIIAHLMSYSDKK